MSQVHARRRAMATPPKLPVKPSKKPTPPPPPPPSFKVLLIGNNYCGTSNELQGCVADIEHAKQFFTANVKSSSYSLSFYELWDKRGPGGNGIVTSARGKGTKKNILAGITWLTTRVKAGDVLYVHYSGHGGTLPSKDPGEDFHVDSTWVPVDYTTAGFIVDNDLRVRLATKIPAGATLWVTSDSCHSGSVLDLRFGFADASFVRSTAVDIPDAEIWSPTLSLPNGKDIKLFDSSKLVTASTVTEDVHYTPTVGTVILVSGCKDLQTSADAFEDNSFQGALTWAFFSCLLQNKNTPLKYLIRDMRQLLALHGYTQIPQLSSGKALDLQTAFSAVLSL
jgi:hypothetical protein